MVKIDSNDDSTETLDFKYDGIEIKSVSDILLLGFGKNNNDEGVFKTFWVNPNKFYEAVGSSWSPSDKIEVK
jgi:hypothetical protein